MASLETRPIAKANPVEHVVTENAADCTMTTAPAANARRMRGSYMISTEDRYCRNCGTRETTLWRRSKNESQLLCNACGTYERLHDLPRPYGICQRTTRRTRRRARRVSGAIKSDQNNDTTQSSVQAHSSTKKKNNSSEEQFSSKASPPPTVIANPMRGRLLQRRPEDPNRQFPPMTTLYSPLIDAQGQYHSLRPSMNAYRRSDTTEFVPIASLPSRCSVSHCDSSDRDNNAVHYDAVGTNRYVSDVPYQQYTCCRCPECTPRHSMVYPNCEPRDHDEDTQRPASMQPEMFIEKQWKCQGWREENVAVRYVNDKTQWENCHWKTTTRSPYICSVDPAHERAALIYNSNYELGPPHGSGRLGNYRSHGVRQSRDIDGPGAYSGTGGGPYYTAEAFSQQSLIPS